MDNKEIDEYIEWVNSRLAFLYRIGCEYNISQEDMKQICRMSHINYLHLANYNGLEIA